ncbi:hypothetical protein [Senegalia massiliensis]|jgi:hypothetical protein|uniref:hypothetical protein n=1 Tax=Senegalia massiliensis TaxID=1720316 RepID=UPI001030D74E|nr:hypothetical protein [Senegalia massiliensis]
MESFKSFSGIVVMIDHFWRGNSDRIGCNKLISVQNPNRQLVNFVVSPDTYFVNRVMVNIGDRVNVFYDANQPTPLIFPPQLQAVVISKPSQLQNVKVDYFDRNLISSDGTLQLNISPSTQIMLENGQVFLGDIKNRNLIVVYGPKTKSIPPQTTPYKVIVMC